MAAGGQLPDGLEAEVEEHLDRARGADRQALRRPGRPAARLRPLGCGRLDARDDGHDPQPGPERRGHGGPGRAHRERPLRPRLVPAPDPDVRRGRGRRLRAPLRGRARRAQARARRRPGHRPRRRRPGRAGRDVQGGLPRGDGLGLPAGRARAADATRCSAVFESWDTPRAQVYRRAHGIPDDLGTAVNVVQMVFGNKGDDSATGVCFTRDPSTGESGLYGEFLVNAQGEDVVSGIRTPEPLERMQEHLPEAFEQLTDTMQRLEEHYKDMQDIEFTIEDGRLYLLQTRTAKRTAAAALKAAVTMVDENADLARGGGRAHRPGPARPAAAPDDRPDGAVRGGRARPERVARRRLREDRLRRRHRSRARRGGRGRHPRPLGDDPGRHPRDDRRAGDPDRTRRHDLARGRRRTRDGQALRRRLRRPPARPRQPARHA